MFNIKYIPFIKKICYNIKNLIIKYYKKTSEKIYFYNNYNNIIPTYFSFTTLTIFYPKS